MIESFTVLATGANDLIKPLHDRMQGIPDRQCAKFWLDEHVTNSDRLKSLFKVFSVERMEVNMSVSWLIQHGTIIRNTLCLYELKNDVTNEL